MAYLCPNDALVCSLGTLIRLSVFPNGADTHESIMSTPKREHISLCPLLKLVLYY